MTTTVFPLKSTGKSQFFDSQGEPLSGGFVYFYTTLTAAAKDTYLDSTGSTLNSNPVELDSRGEADIYLTPDTAYKVILRDSDGVLIWSLDPVWPVIDGRAFGETLTAETTPANNDELAIRDVSADTIKRVTLSTIQQNVNAFGFPINLQVSPSVASNALTVAFKYKDGTDPSASQVVVFPMRSGTATSGAFNNRTLATAASVVVPNTALLGHTSALKQYIYVYAIDNSGTIEVAVSSKFFGWQGIVSTTAVSTAADSGTVMYSTTLRSSVPYACVAMLEVTEAAAGVWATAPSQVNPAPFTFPTVSFSAHKNTTNQTSVASGAYTKVTFGTTIYNNGSLLSSSTFTPPPGTIKLNSTVSYTSIVDGSAVIIAFYKNGVLLKEVTGRASSTASIGVDLGIEDECGGTDTYEVYTFQNQGSDGTINGAIADTYFMGSWSPLRS